MKRKRATEPSIVTRPVSEHVHFPRVPMIERKNDRLSVCAAARLFLGRFQKPRKRTNIDRKTSTQST